MNEHLEDPFAVLRRLVGDHQPSAEAEQKALRRLQEAIAAETTLLRISNGRPPSTGRE